MSNFFSRISMPVCIFGLVFFSFLIYSGYVIAGTTPPVTVHSLTGTLGNDNWYRSDIDVTLTATDAESGVSQITYWIDSGSPVTDNFSTTPVDQFANNSMESGWWLSINNWYSGLSGLALYYRSSVAAYQGNRSAAIAFIDFGGSDFYHWHNEPHSVEYPAGQDAQITAWARTVVFPGDVAFFEVWGEDINGNNDHLLATSNQLADFSWSWREASASFAVPSDGTNYIYVKLGSLGSPAAIVYWDYVVGSSVLTTAETNFTFVDEGSHTLHYFAQDNASNVEIANSTVLKKDTVIPNPWQDFNNTAGGCGVCYVTSADVQDTTSGIDVGSAEYRYYTEYGGQYWSGWNAVSTVTVVSSGLPAASGETGLVRLTSPELDFGDTSGRPFRVQFRINDQAGNSSSSPVYEIISPWMRALDGSIYIGGEISVPASPTGDDNGNADVMTDDDIVSFTTTTNWMDDDYQHDYFGVTQIEDLLSEYDRIKSESSGLPSGQLPTSDGIYLYSGNYTINSGTIPSGYDTANVSAVVVIEGDLTIADGFTVAEENNTVFLIEGNLSIESTVEDIAGFYIAEGQFDSDVDGTASAQLVVDGSVLALQGYSLPRDLGDDNATTPAEQFNWQIDMLVDSTLTQYLTQSEMEYSWKEVVGN